jgi:hypothetical protein
MRANDPYATDLTPGAIPRAKSNRRRRDAANSLLGIMPLAYESRIEGRIMEFETHVGEGQVEVKHIEGHTYVFKIGEGDLISDTTYRSEPFVSHGAEHFIAAAREAAQQAYIVSKNGHRP